MPTKTRYTAEDERALRRARSQGEPGSLGFCDDCGREVNGRRGWWKETHFAEDPSEWDCLCKACAVKDLHRWDNTEICDCGRIQECPRCGGFGLYERQETP